MSTYIIRKIDDLGRIVLPKDLRKALNINSGDDFQITIDNDKIVLEKFSRLEKYEDTINTIINCFYSVTNYKIYVSINNKIINFNNEEITSIISNIINTRKLYFNDKFDKNVLSNNLIVEGKIVILPIVLNSDLLGSIIIIDKDNINSLINTAKIMNNLIKKLLVY